MSIAVQGADKLMHYCVECDCCGRTARSKIWWCPDGWVAGSFHGKIRHICHDCVHEYLTGEHTSGWRW